MLESIKSKLNSIKFIYVSLTSIVEEKMTVKYLPTLL